jgi:hypothetical protein
MFDATDEEAEDPQDQGDDQHDPQDVGGEAKPAEQGEYQQQHD